MADQNLAGKAAVASNNAPNYYNHTPDEDLSKYEKEKAYIKEAQEADEEKRQQERVAINQLNKARGEREDIAVTLFGSVEEIPDEVPDYTNLDLIRKHNDKIDSAMMQQNERVTGLTDTKKTTPSGKDDVEIGDW